MNFIDENNLHKIGNKSVYNVVCKHNGCDPDHYEGPGWYFLNKGTLEWICD